MSSFPDSSLYFGLAQEQSLPSLVAQKFYTAKERSNLIFSHTYLSIIHCNGIPVRQLSLPSIPS